MQNGTRKWVVEVVSSQVVPSATVYCPGPPLYPADDGRVDPAGRVRLHHPPGPDPSLQHLSDPLTSQALENGVSMWPKLEGRFPQVTPLIRPPPSLSLYVQVSGITFAFDPSKPPGSRVNPDYVKVGGRQGCREGSRQAGRQAGKGQGMQA